MENNGPQTARPMPNDFSDDFGPSRDAVTPVSVQELWSVFWPTLAKTLSEIHEDLKDLSANLTAIHESLESQVKQNQAASEINALNLEQVKAMMSGSPVLSKPVLMPAPGQKIRL